MANACLSTRPLPLFEKGDLCYLPFAEHGFEWCRDWTDRKDYQHFEIPDEKIAEWYPENVEQ